MKWFWGKETKEEVVKPAYREPTAKAYVLLCRSSGLTEKDDEEMIRRLQRKYGTTDLAVVITDKPVEVILLDKSIEVELNASTD